MIGMKKVTTITILLSIVVSGIILPYHMMPNTRTLYQKVKTHFYCIKCLALSTYLLSRLDQQHYHYCPCNIREQQHYIQIDAAIFSHRTIRRCIKKIVQTKSLQPLLVLLQEAKKYSLIKNHHFFH